jgi:hypothetical protein
MSATNAVSGDIDGIQVKDTNWRTQIKLNDTKTVKGTVISESGDIDTCEIIITGLESEAPKCTLKAEPQRITKNTNTPVTFTIVPENAQYGTIDGSTVDASSSPSWTRTIYNINESKEVVAKVFSQYGKESECKASVTVVEPEAPTCTISSPVSEVFSGFEAQVLVIMTQSNGDYGMIDGKRVDSSNSWREILRLTLTSSKTISATVTSSSGQTVKCSNSVPIAVRYN